MSSTLSPSLPYAETTIHLPQEEPRVFFDVSIGKTIPEGKIADFNNDAFLSLMQEMEPADAQAAYQSTIVHIADPRDRSTLMHFSAGYIPSEGRIIVPDGPRSNRRLAHETRHYLDDRQNKMGPLGLIAATNTVQLISTIGCIPATVAECVSRSPTMTAISWGVVALTLISNGANLSFPWERRARRAQSRYDYHVIT